MKKLALATLLALAATSAAAARLRLIVRNVSPVKRVDEPVTAGVPWPQGALHSAAELRLLDANAVELPLQVAVVSRWPDGSLKWALLDLRATVDAGARTTYRLDYGPGVSRRERVVRPLHIREDETRITVETGAATFRVRKEGFGLFEEVRLAGQAEPVAARSEAGGLRLVATEERASLRSRGRQAFVQLPAADRVFLGRHRAGARWFRQRGFRVVDAASGEPAGIDVAGASLDPEGKHDVVGHGWTKGAILQLSRVPGRPVQIRYPRAARAPLTFYSSLGSAKVGVETAGPLRAVIRAAGKFQASDGSRLCDYVARLHFYAGKALVRLELTLVNREAMPLSKGLETYPLLLDDVTLALPLTLRVPQSFVFAGPREGSATHRGAFLHASGHAKLVQYPSRRVALAHYVVTREGKTLAARAQSMGAVGLCDRKQGVAVAVREAWLNNPKALRLAAKGRIEIGIHPAEAGPCEELLAGRAKTHDVLFAFHGPEPPDLHGLSIALDAPLAAYASPDADGAPTGQWYAETGALGPLAPGASGLAFARDFGALLANVDGTGAIGVWHYGAQGTRPCRVDRFRIASATRTTIGVPRLSGVATAKGRALVVLSGRAAGLGRVAPLIVTDADSAQATLSFVKPVAPVPEQGAEAALVDPHGAFLCHRFDPAYALAREYVRRGTPGTLHFAWTTARHLADVGTFHGGQASAAAWTGACHDPALGPTAHHVPGLSPEASWYAGAWLVFLLTGDRAVLASALENATFAARHADEPATSPLAAALAVINLSFAVDVAPVAAPERAAAYRKALGTYVGKLLEAQRTNPHGLYAGHSIVDGICLEALAAYHRVHNDARVLASLRRAGEALIRPNLLWSGHEKIGRLWSPLGAHVKPYATADGLVADYARHPEAAAYGLDCGLVAAQLAFLTEVTGDTKYIKKARRLERVAALFEARTAREFALRYRQGGLFETMWERYIRRHPLATDGAIAFQCRLENAADVALPDVGAGGGVLFRPFAALPDGSGAYQARGPSLGEHPRAGLWIPLAGSSNLDESQGAIEFRICYHKGPGPRRTPLIASGSLPGHGFAVTLKGRGLALTSRHRQGPRTRILASDLAVEQGRWHHIAFAWRHHLGASLFFDGRRVGQAPGGYLGFGRHLVVPYDPADADNEFLIDDLRIWKRVLARFDAAADLAPPAPITDLRLLPARDARYRLIWTAPGDDGRKGQARRYDVRVSTQRLGPISWGGYGEAGDPVGEVHWAEADRIAGAPKPQPAGQAERMLIGPFPPDRRIYVAIKTHDEANASLLSNVVTNHVSHRPTADPGPRLRQAITGSLVAFDARGSSDPDYNDLTYHWSNGIKGAVGTRRYDKPGTYNITLTVHDGKAADTASTRLIVGNAVRVSFQPRSEPVPKGFVADAAAVYCRARGFGWREVPPGTTAFVRKGAGKLPAAARTGIRVSRAAEWRLDLPNGPYDLTLSLGDPARPPAPRRITIQDGYLSLRLGDPARPGQPPKEPEINYLTIQRAKPASPAKGRSEKPTDQPR